MASVTGPRQAPGHKENAEHAVLDVVFLPWSGSPGGRGKVRDRSLSSCSPLNPVLDVDTPVSCLRTGMPFITQAHITMPLHCV